MSVCQRFVDKCKKYIPASRVPDCSVFPTSTITVPLGPFESVSVRCTESKREVSGAAVALLSPSSLCVCLVCVCVCVCVCVFVWYWFEASHSMTIVMIVMMTDRPINVKCTSLVLPRR